MEEKNYSEHINKIKDLISKVSNLIESNEELQKMNFGLFYQHGRLGFVDLDAFAKSTKVKIEENGEEKTLTDLTQKIDREEKE